MGETGASVVREVSGATFDREERAGPVPGPGSWVQIDACTLPTAEQPLRVAEFDALFAGALRKLELREPGWLRLVLAPGAGVQAADVEASTRELIARESVCCSFFDFHLTPTIDGELVLDVRVPDTRVEVLDGIIRQAQAAQASAAQARAAGSAS